MLACIELEIAEPSFPCDLVAKTCGVALETLYGYHMNPLYKEEKARRLKEKFAGLEAKAMDSLDANVSAGDWNATKWVLEALGYGKEEVKKVQVSMDDTIKIRIE